MCALVTNKELDKIINGCKQNDRSAQKALVETYTPMLLYTARRYTSDLHKAKDVLQETFINVLKAIDKFKLGTPASFESWLRRIVINNALKEKRKSFHRKELNGFENLPDQKIFPTVMSKLGVEEIEEYIEQMPEGYRTVFQMYVVDDLSHDEIAELLGISASTSRSQLVRARAFLKKICLGNQKTLAS